MNEWKKTFDEEKKEKIVILLIVIFLIINGVLVIKLLRNEVEFDKTCPVPKEDISFCECFYNALGDKSLRYCICYPGEKIDIEEMLVGPRMENGEFYKFEQESLDPGFYVSDNEKEVLN